MRWNLSCGLHDGECNLCRLGETGAAEGGRDDLIVTTAGAEEVAEFAMLPTEAGSGIVALEAAHTSDPVFDATMVLFKTIVQVDVGSMADRSTQHAADRPEIGAMAMGLSGISCGAADGTVPRCTASSTICARATPSSCGSWTACRAR